MQKFGQHFLTDAPTAKRIVDSLGIVKGDCVVEIGPGKGALTHLIADRAEKVFAIERDEGLAELIGRRFENHPNMSVLTSDARWFDFASCTDNPNGCYKVIGNLPYYAASKIIQRLLASEIPPVVIVTMVQKEVAETMAAAPGRMRFLSLLIQSKGRVQKMFDVPPSAFRPQPKVTSSIIRIHPLASRQLDLEKSPLALRLAKAAFHSSRKTLRNSLSAGMHVSHQHVEDVLKRGGIDPFRRPATLSLPEWKNLTDLWGDSLPNADLFQSRGAEDRAK